MYQYISLPNSQELDRLGEIDCQCFGTSLSEWEPYLNQIGKENFRLIAQEDKAMPLVSSFR